MQIRHFMNHLAINVFCTHKLVKKWIFVHYFQLLVVCGSELNNDPYIKFIGLSNWGVGPLFLYPSASHQGAQPLPRPWASDLRLCSARLLVVEGWREKESWCLTALQQLGSLYAVGLYLCPWKMKQKAGSFLGDVSVLYYRLQRCCSLFLTIPKSAIFLQGIYSL